MISYGNVALSLGDGELHDLIERGIDPIGVLREFQDPEWSGLDTWKVPDYAGRRHPKLYSLYWPRGASRWAEAHFLATENELDEIRGKAYTGDSRGILPLELKIDDDAQSITASMYMMPPRPLFQIEGQNPPGANLYLLTLVDVRYWWWRKPAEIFVSPGVTSWESLYASIASALGITITVDPIPAEYLRPPIELQNLFFYLPPMLDAVAYSVGQRIVRSLDGAVMAQNAGTGIGRQSFLYDLYAKDNINFGGIFRFDKTLRRPDLPPLVPGTVRTVYPQRTVTSSVDLLDPCSAEQCVPGRTYYEKDLVVLNLPEYRGRTVMRGHKIFHSTAVAWLSNIADDIGIISNATILQEMNDQLAEDWYRWQLGMMSQVLAGIVPWNQTEAEGASDYVEWEATPNKMRTRIMRETMNDLAFKVYHYTPNPGMSDPYSSSSSSSLSSSSSSSSSGGGSVASPCNYNEGVTDTVPTLLYATFTYGIYTLSVPLTYNGSEWRYQGALLPICNGLDVAELNLTCQGVVWYFEVVLLNHLYTPPLYFDYQTPTSIAALTINSTNPVNYTTQVYVLPTTCDPSGTVPMYVEITP